MRRVLFLLILKRAGSVTVMVAISKLFIYDFAGSGHKPR